MVCGGRNFRFRVVVTKIVETLRPPPEGGAHLGHVFRGQVLDTSSTMFIGRRVCITNLEARPELNGQHGLAVAFDDSKGRYNVKLERDGSFVSLKPTSLMAEMMPCSSTPTKVKTKVALLDGGDLSHALQGALESVFARFDADHDSALSEPELQAFARACNGGETFEDEELDEIRQFFETTPNGCLTRKGFLQMYHTQTLARPHDTWSDLKALGFNNNLERVAGGCSGARRAALSPEPSAGRAPSTPVALDAAIQCARSDELYAAGKHFEALRAGMVAMQQDQGCAEAHRCVGRALYALGRVEAAERSWQRAAELEGTSSAVTSAHAGSTDAHAGSTVAHPGSTDAQPAAPSLTASPPTAPPPVPSTAVPPVPSTYSSEAAVVSEALAVRIPHVDCLADSGAMAAALPAAVPSEQPAATLSKLEAALEVVDCEFAAELAAVQAHKAALEAKDARLRERHAVLVAAQQRARDAADGARSDAPTAEAHPRTPRAPHPQSAAPEPGGSWPHANPMIALDDEQHLAHDTRCVRVSGAGNPAADGLYVGAAATHNGCPLWVRTDPAAHATAHATAVAEGAAAGATVSASTGTSMRAASASPGTWRLYWSCGPADVGWCIGTDFSMAVYVCEMDLGLGAQLGRWAEDEEAMYAWCESEGQCTELFTRRWEASGCFSGAGDGPMLTACDV